MKRVLALLLLMALTPGAVAASTVGSVSMLFGGTVDHRGGGPARFGGLAMLSAEFSPFLAVGPEVGFFRPRESSSVVVTGLSARAEPDWPTLRPYATTGAGIYFWDDDPAGGVNFIGMHIGAGVRWPARSALTLRFDARLHLQLQNLGFEERYDFMTYLLGVQASW